MHDVPLQWHGEQSLIGYIPNSKVTMQRSFRLEYCSSRNFGRRVSVVPAIGFAVMSCFLINVPECTDFAQVDSSSKIIDLENHLAAFLMMSYDR